jgi:predicted DNA-binding protein
VPAVAADLPTAMHTTTVRFDDETWQRLQAASRRAGTSKAQYIRDATVARLAQAAHLPELADLRRELERLSARLDAGWRP